MEGVFKVINTDGVTYMEAIPGGTGEWYFAISYEHGDLYEAEELYRHGRRVNGRTLCLIHYPDGEVFRPVPKQPGTYSEKPVISDGGIFILNAEFIRDVFRIIRFDCVSHETETFCEIPMSEVKDCYNLSLDISPLTVTRQCVMDNEFEIIWPEKAAFTMGDHDSFFLRDGDRLFFSRWHEEGEGADYRYWEETVVRDLDGNITDVLEGDVRLMPNGEIWHLK